MSRLLKCYGALHLVKKNIYSFIKIFLCFTLLSACTTLGPNHKTPQITWADNWHPDLYNQVLVSKKEVDVQDTTPKKIKTLEPKIEQHSLNLWWKTFNDPALDNLMNIAEKENLTLRIAGLRILESRARLGIADSLLYPQVQQVSGSTLATKTQTRGGVLPDSDDDFVSYDASLNLGWELDFWGKFKRGIEAADSAFMNSLASYNDMQVILKAQIASLYFSYRTNELRILIAKKNAAIQKRSYEITEKIFIQGQDSELDLQQAKSQYLATLASIPRLELSLIRIRNSLATLLGRPPGDIPEIPPAKETFKLPVLSHINIEDLPATLLMRRPDIRAAAYNVAAQSAQIGIAEADFYPSISLLGTLGWSGSSLDSASNNTVLAAGPSFSWNIFDYGRIKNNIRIQDARLQQAIENYQNEVISAAQEIDDATIGMLKSKEQMDIYSQSVIASERALYLANQRYREGYSDFQRVLDAQRTFFSQTEQELINKGNHISAIIDVYKALGGGWSPKEINEILPENTRKTMSERSDWGDVLTTPLTDSSLKNISPNNTVIEAEAP